MTAAQQEKREQLSKWAKPIRTSWHPMLAVKEKKQKQKKGGK